MSGSQLLEPTGETPTPTLPPSAGLGASRRTGGGGNAATWVLLVLLIIGAVVFFAGINWGLPSRSADRFLFGGEPAWSGKKIMDLAGERPDDPRLGANVPIHILDRSQTLPLNATDADRARIIRRYRLYSQQPDENTLLMAIARMRPAKWDFDPHFYQYGGWFVYPVAGLLKFAGIVHLLKLSPDAVYYLDHPDKFGRFYIVARSWSAVWGLVGAWAIFWIGRRLTGDLWSAAMMTLGFIFMPVVINQAHEAKPHLQGAVLTLLGVIAAFKYVERGERKYAWLAGALCGAAFGSVVSMLWALAVLPAMAWRRGGWKILVGSVVIAIAVYAIGNPYVLINAFWNREVLRSNLGNSTGMYRVSLGGFRNGWRLMAEGASPAVIICAIWLWPAALLGWNRRKPNSYQAKERWVLMGLLAGPFVLILTQYLLLANDKPAEYGRFAIYVNVVLAIMAWTGLAAPTGRPLLDWVLTFALVAITAVSGFAYIHAFFRNDTRTIAAESIAGVKGEHVIGLWAEPAPYSMPPVDLFHNRVLLLPVGMRPSAGDSPCDLLVWASDDPAHQKPRAIGFDRTVVQSRWLARISWADKPFEIYYRKPATR